MDHPEQSESWFEKRKNQDRIFHALGGICGLLLLAEFAYHAHPHFAFESWFGFHAGFGFLAYVSIVTSAKGLRRLVRRPEDYYSD